VTARVGLAAALVGCVLAANWLASTFGQIPVGFGLVAVAGTWTAGLALALRDLLQESGGVRWVLATIAAGCVLSYLLADGRIAVASAVAFGAAELADLAVYTPLRARRWRTAVIASNAVGAVVDTLLFLSIAGFGLTWSGVGGQLLVKAVWVTATFLALAEGVRRLRARSAASA
jgi:uncharacterized PurR-regulated membrane protein YhhQ (DUF165 family)